MNPDTNTSFVNKVLLRQTIGSVRLVIALFTITAAITKLLYDYLLPDLNDLDMVRWTIIGLGCVFFATTFFRYKRSVVVTTFYLLLYLSTLLYVIAFVLINRFNPHTVTILILVVGASSIIINSLLYYGVQSFIIMLACLLAYVNGGLAHENLISFINLILALAVFAIVIIVRLKLISSVMSSNRMLEQLNALSIIANKDGEIIFISSSVRNLLGYEPKELLKDGWWTSPNVSKGWIDREYILNYPNILPKELMTLETSLLNKEGKKVWFSWVNSLLPNGNYIGVALDVTKYKEKHMVVH